MYTPVTSTTESESENEAATCIKSGGAAATQCSVPADQQQIRAVGTPLQVGGEPGKLTSVAGSSSEELAVPLDKTYDSPHSAFPQVSKDITLSMLLLLN